MTTILAIAAGGATGALLRYWCSQAVYGLLGKGFPYGTLSVNVIGSFLMGYLFIMLNERLAVAAEWRAFMLIGMLGAFTTFSTFSLETMNLIEQGEVFKAGLNIVFSVSLCVIACWFGLVIGRQ